MSGPDFSSYTGSVSFSWSADCARCGTSWTYGVVLRQLDDLAEPVYLACPHCGLLTRNQIDFTDADIVGDDRHVAVSGMRMRFLQTLYDPRAGEGP